MTVWESSARRVEQRAGERVLGAFWRFKWLLLAAAIVGAVSGYVVSSLQSNVYAASARVILADRLGGDVLDTLVPSISDSARYTRNQAELMDSPTVANLAAAALGEAVTPGAVAASTDATPTEGVDVVVVRATRQSPEEAADFANAVAEAYAEVKSSEAQAAADAAISQLNEFRLPLETELRDLQAELDANPGDPTLEARRNRTVAELVSIEDRVDELAVSAALHGSGVQLIEQAGVPGSPISPKPMRTAVAAGTIALLLAMGFAWWRSEEVPVLDDVHDPAPLLQAPLLGEIPVLTTEATDELTPAEPGQPAAEAYHYVYTSLAMHLEENAALMIAVTSPGAGQGKTSMVLNLAVAGASAGMSVLMVDADERARGLSLALGHNDEKGLTDVGAGNGVGPDDLAVAIPVAEGPGYGQVSLLAAGSRLQGGSPAGFFHRPGFRKAMSQIRSSAEFVLVDTPPALAVAEVPDIVREVDGVVVVLTPGDPLDVVLDLRERLAVAGTPIFGYVVNKARSRSDAYGYGSEAETRISRLGSGLRLRSRRRR